MICPPIGDETGYHDVESGKHLWDGAAMEQYVGYDSPASALIFCSLDSGAIGDAKFSTEIGICTFGEPFCISFSLGVRPR